MKNEARLLLLMDKIHDPVLQFLALNLVIAAHGRDRQLGPLTNSTFSDTFII